MPCASAFLTSDCEIPNCLAIADGLTPALKAARTAFSLPVVNEPAPSWAASWRRCGFASATGFSFAGLGGRRPRRSASVVTAASSASISTSSNRFSAVEAREAFRCVLHSNRTQRERVEALEGFKSGKYEIMVATDIAARGIDIAGISHVINYDVPEHSEDYVHRIGRTGRAQKVGDAFSLMNGEELGSLQAIERFIGAKIPRLKLDGFPISTPRFSNPNPSQEPVNARLVGVALTAAIPMADGAATERASRARVVPVKRSPQGDRPALVQTITR